VYCVSKAGGQTNTVPPQTRLGPYAHGDSQANEREYVLNVLGGNDYPKRFLNDCLSSPVCRNQNNSEGDTSVKGYPIVPYIQGVTEPIKRILGNCNINYGCLKTLFDFWPYFRKAKRSC
jgi:hypothetical protein